MVILCEFNITNLFQYSLSIVIKPGILFIFLQLYQCASGFSENYSPNFNWTQWSVKLRWCKTCTLPRPALGLVRLKLWLNSLNSSTSPGIFPLSVQCHPLCFIPKIYSLTFLHLKFHMCLLVPVSSWSSLPISLRYVRGHTLIAPADFNFKSCTQQPLDNYSTYTKTKNGSNIDC